MVSTCYLSSASVVFIHVYVSPLTTNVPHHVETSKLINWLVSIYWRTLVVNRLKDFNHVTVKKVIEKKDKQEINDGPVRSSSKQHEDERVRINCWYDYQGFSRFSCSYFVLLILPNKTIFRQHAISWFPMFLVVAIFNGLVRSVLWKMKQGKMKLLFSV